MLPVERRKVIQVPGFPIPRRTCVGGNFGLNCGIKQSCKHIFVVLSLLKSILYSADKEDRSHGK